MMLTQLVSIVVIGYLFGSCLLGIMFWTGFIEAVDTKHGKPVPWWIYLGFVVSWPVLLFINQDDEER